jgi:polyphosphate glucokinase
MTKKRRSRKAQSQILIVDVGGTHIKFEISGQPERREFKSGPKLSAKRMVSEVKRRTADWSYDVVSIGYPGLVVRDRVVAEPHNLGHGWSGFDFGKAFGCPVKIINDAAMQALGSYQGGKMLFLGLGTGLGTAMIVDGVIEPMELAHLPYRKGKTFEDYVGVAGLKRLGKKKWRKHVVDVIKRLMAALEPEYVVLGGGNVDKLGKLPSRVRKGDNDNAFIGGHKLWS